MYEYREVLWDSCPNIIGQYASKLLYKSSLQLFHIQSLLMQVCLQLTILLLY